MEQLFGSEVTFAHMRRLSKLFGNSITTTMWRTVESMEIPTLGFAHSTPRSNRAGQ